MSGQNGRLRRLSRLLAAACVASSCPAALAANLTKIQTIVVIFPENRSFDHLYGLFPGANGIANATKEQYTQRDHDGRRGRT
jgi:phospholipase C